MSAKRPTPPPSRNQSLSHIVRPTPPPPPPARFPESSAYRAFVDIGIQRERNRVLAILDSASGVSPAAIVSDIRKKILHP